MIDYVVGEACMLSDVLRVIERDRRTMSNNTHVTDVGGLVHESPDLVCIAAIVSTTQTITVLKDAVYEPTVKLLVSKKAQ